MQYKTNPYDIKPNDIYIAIKNNTFDGHQYIDTALNYGARKIIGEENLLYYKKYKRVPDSLKYLNKVLIKQNKLLLKQFKTILLISSNINEDMLLYRLLKKLGNSCTFISYQNFFYHNQSDLFDANAVDSRILYNILLKAKELNTKYLIINIPFQYIDVIKHISPDIAVMYDNDITLNKSIKKSLKRTKSLIIIDKDYPTIRRKNNVIRIGKDSNYIINNYQYPSKSTIINFDHQYSKYFLKVKSQDSVVVCKYFLSLITAVELGYDMVDIIKCLNKIKPQKKTNY